MDKKERWGGEGERKRKKKRVREGRGREILPGPKYNLQKHNTYSEHTVNNFLQLGSTHFLQLGPTPEVFLAYLIVPQPRD